MTQSHTRAVHAGAAANPSRALAMPIYQTSTFRFTSCEQGARLSAEVAPDELYTRWGNPTTRALELAVAELEGAEDAMAFASGMGAGSAAVMAAVRGGDHVVAANCLYTGMTELFENVLARYGVETTFVDPAVPFAFHDAMRPSTRLIYVETPANPTLAITDLTEVAELARSRDVLTMADNTWASPWNQNPIALGIDAVVHSATKYLGGHSDVISGVVAGSRDFCRRVWAMRKVFGANAGPHDAYLTLRGVRTLGLRVERQNASAQRVAEFLAGHPRVAVVHYPGLAQHPGHEVAKRQMRGFGGMLAFEVQGGIDAGRRTIEALRVITHAVSLGGVESLAVHAASTTHGPLSEEARLRAGVTPGLIRMSIGLEDADDLIADLEQALAR